MRSHAKASTAGSTQRQAGRLGRIFRGALATRGASLTAKGSGAPKARRLVLPLAVLALVLALAVPPASALKLHVFKEVFGSAAQPTVNAWALGIDQSNGDVLVMDATSGDFTVKRFNADGTPDNFSALGTNVIDGEGGADATPQGGLEFGLSVESQVAVDSSGGATDGNIYVTQGFPNLINVFSSTGAYLGQLTAAGATDFSEACGVAVDSSGAVYVGDRTGGIHKFVPAANPPVNADHAATFTSTSEPCALAAGAGSTAGFLFPTQHTGPISKIDSSTGELKYTVASGSHTTVAVDTGTGHVYGMGSGTIKEFDASGAGSATDVTNTPINGAQQGLAVRGSSGDIFYSVSISTSNKIQVLGGAISTAPDVVTNAATSVGATTATVNGTVNPDGVGLSECKFEYGKTTTYGQSVPCAESLGSIGSGTSPVAVHADVSGLDVGGAVYHFRLVAANPEASIDGDDQSFATNGPEISDTWAEDVTVTEAKLRAEINPKGLATTYRFEYGPTTTYGSESAELNVGSDSSPHKVQLSLEDLDPGTTYHYRVIATNGDAENVGPDREIRTFRTFSVETDCINLANRYGAGANLPDCRAYEMVSPVDKGNGDIKSLGTSEFAWPARRTKSTPAGDKLTYSSTTAFSDTLSAPYSSQYIAQRLPGGWETHAINPPQTTGVVTGLPGQRAQYDAFSDDLCQGWMLNTHEPTLSPGGLPGLRNLYRYNDRLCGPQRFEAAGPIVGGVFGANNAPVSTMGVSADGSHAIFTSAGKLAPEGTEGTTQIYESTEPETLPRFVCILPNGEPDTGPCMAGTGHREPCCGYPAPHRISDDGSRIFWASAGFFGGSGKLYVRIDGSETVAISQAGEEEAGTSQSWFAGASADGSRAIYWTDPGDNKLLFAFDVDSEATEPIAAGVYGVLGMSDDARRVYFLSREVLPGSGANSEGNQAIEGQPNLYLYDADAGGAGFTFINMLASEDTDLTGSSPVAREARYHNGHVTADGRYAAFASFASLTGYDNESTEGSLNPVAYVYDAQRDELICASCIPSGARGVREAREDNASAEVIRTYETFMIPVGVLTPGRLFFNSANAFTPGDTNGRQDVYQWEQAGVGGCDAGDSAYAPSAKGCIALISSGKSVADSEFAAASASGDDAFFYTTSSLVPQDFARRDIYDASVGGGFPLPPEVPECIGDACQSIPPAPNDPTPASASFRGAGDPAPRKAKRRCRARNRQQAKGGKARHSKAKHKKAKRCRRNNGRAGR